MVRYLEEKRIILNLTGRPVIAYDSEGRLVELTPTTSSETEFIDEDGLKVKVVRLVTDEQYCGLSKDELAKVDYAYVASFDRGRNNIPVVRLERQSLVDGEKKLYRVYPISRRDHQSISKWNRYHHTIAG